MFDEKTRAASQANLEGFGTAFAGRGESINTAIGAFRPLLRDIVPVMQNLSAPETGLGRLRHRAQRRRGDRRARPAETQASLFRNLDATMAALREVARPYIQDSITGGKPALDAGIESLPRQRPFLRNTEGLMVELRPGVRALRTAAPVLSDALQTGIEVLPKTPPLNRRLDSLLQEVKVFADDPLVPRGIQNTTDLVKSLRPTLDYLAPTQTGLQLRDAVVPQHLLAAERGRPQRHLAALHHRHHPAGPQQRGRPVVGARQRPDASPTTCTSTRTRTPPRPASRASARRATRSTWPARRSRPTSRARSRRGPRATREHGDQVMARTGRRTPKRSNAFVGLMAVDRRRPDHVLRLHQGHPVHAAASRSRRSSSRPTRSGPTRRCGSRASRSARSSPSTGVEGSNAARAGDGAQGHRAAAARGRDAPRSGRASSSRATSSSTSSRARRARPCSTPATRSRSPRRPRRCSSTRC